MTWVRRLSIIGVMVGVTAWTLSATTGEHEHPWKVLIYFSQEHGVLVSDVPPFLGWLATVGLGVHLLRR